MTNTIDDYETTDMTLVGSLNAGHTGDDTLLVIEKSYRYAGEDRTKVLTLSRPNRIEHYRTSKGFNTRVFAYPDNGYYRSWHYLKSMDNVVVMVRKAK